MCDKDCFNCKYEDCINDELSHDDIQSLQQMEVDFLPDAHKRQNQSDKARERSREYARKNKDKLREYQINREKALNEIGQICHEACSGLSGRDYAVAFRTAWADETSKRKAVTYV